MAYANELVDAQMYNSAVDRLNALLNLRGSKNVAVNISPLGVNVSCVGVVEGGLLTDPEMGDNEWDIA